MELTLLLKDNLSAEEAKLAFSVAEALEDGNCFMEDRETALKLYAASARAGYSRGYGRIGEMLEDTDLSKAILYYKKGAGSGDIFSMVQLGCILEEQGKTGDAAYCYEMAAKAEDPEGMYRYGLLVTDGEEKISWLRKAADKGYVYAPRALGEVYEMKDNQNLALFWYRQGLELGDTEVSGRISVLEEKNEEEIDVVIEYDDEETM